MVVSTSSGLFLPRMQYFMFVVYTSALLVRVARHMFRSYTLIKLDPWLSPSLSARSSLRTRRSKGGVHTFVTRTLPFPWWLDASTAAIAHVGVSVVCSVEVFGEPAFLCLQSSSPFSSIYDEILWYLRRSRDLGWDRLHTATVLRTTLCVLMLYRQS